MKMNRWSMGLGLAAIMTAAPFLASAPVMASLQQAGEAIAQTLRRPDVKLNLTAEQQVVEKDLAGETKTSWKDLSGKVTVHPGDVLRYTVTGQNAGESAAKKLSVTQPIPKQMAYVMDSTSHSGSAKTVYSIDNGQHFVDQPMIAVTLPNGQVEEQPAPAEAYTHVRWQFDNTLNPNAGVKASYQAKVR
jgi:uncharacterized repeat protein (TIGR01451 family)